MTQPQLSYIVPSFNRQNFLRRLIFSLSEYNVELVIVDGTEKEWGSGTRGNFNAIRWKYIHQPGEFNYFDRLKLGLENAKGTYICILDDQDIFLPKIQPRLIEISKAQKKAEGIVVAACAMAGLQYEKDFPQLVKIGHYTEKFYAEEPEGLERIKSVIQNKRTASFYYQPMHREHLEEFLNITLPIVKNSRPRWLGFAEFAFAIFLANRGKLVVMDKIGWVRQIYSHSEKAISSEEIEAYPNEDDISALVRVFNESRKHIKYQNIKDEEKEFISILKGSHEFILPERTKSLSKFRLLVYSLLKYVHRKLKQAGFVMKRFRTSLYLFKSLDSFREVDKINLKKNQHESSVLHLLWDSNNDFSMHYYTVLGIYETFPHGIDRVSFEELSRR